MRIDERRQILQALPKIELHRHLEGSMRLSTLMEFGRNRGLDLPLGDPEDLAPLVTFCEGEPRTLANFLTKFRADWYRSYADIERVASEAVQDAAREGIVYLELRFSPEHYSRRNNLSCEGVIQAVLAAGSSAADEENIELRFLLTFARERYDDALWRHLLELAIRHQPQGIVGLDLAGDEFGHPNEQFVDFFRRVRDTGLLGITVHAGEGTSPGSVASAVQLLGANRIGHGVRAADDENVARLLKESKVTLEMCPISNYQTGCIDDLSAHPLPRLERQAVPVTINSDDPSIHRADLNDNYDVAVTHWGYDLKDLLRLELQAADAAFLPEPRRKELRRRVEQGYRRVSNLGI